MSLLWSNLSASKWLQQRDQRRLRALQRWQHSPQRATLEACAREVLQPHLREVFGRWCVQYGSAGGSVVTHVDTLRSVCAAPVEDREAGLCFDGARMPLATGSVDLFVLVFALEFSPSPHALLREACRVMSDRGVLLIVGQSPYGAAAAKRVLGASGGCLPHGSTLLRPGRLRDWLALLDLELVTQEAFGVGWPARGQARSTAARWMADCYMLRARKRVAAQTPAARPAFRRRKPKVAGVPVGNMREPLVRAGRR